jgi:glucokinase
VAIAALLVTVSPRKVVIGGGVAAASDLFFDAIRKTLIERVTVMTVEQAEVVKASLGDDAGILGVSRWVSRSSERNGD